MLESYNGKLLIYASSSALSEKRMKSLSVAVEKMAKLLNLDFEVVPFKDRFTPIYVYYKNGAEEPIPVYCSKDEEADRQEISTALRNMMFVLSFHPKNCALRRRRREIMRFS